MKPVKQVLKDVNVKKEEIDEVCMLLNGRVLGVLMTRIRSCSLAVLLE